MSPAFLYAKQEFTYWQSYYAIRFMFVHIFRQIQKYVELIMCQVSVGCNLQNKNWTMA